MTTNSKNKSEVKDQRITKQDLKNKTYVLLGLQLKAAKWKLKIFENKLKRSNLQFVDEDGDAIDILQMYMTF